MWKVLMVFVCVVLAGCGNVPIHVNRPSFYKDAEQFIGASVDQVTERFWIPDYRISGSEKRYLLYAVPWKNPTGDKYCLLFELDANGRVKGLREQMSTAGAKSKICLERFWPQRELATLIIDDGWEEVDDNTSPGIKGSYTVMYRAYLKYGTYDRKAFESFLGAAKKGNSDAQYVVGESYRTGNGVPGDRETGLYWLNKAAEQYHKYAQYSLGSLYASNTDSLADQTIAAKWFYAASRQGYGKAIDQLEALAKRGNAEAQYDIGHMYMREIGKLQQDYTKGLIWLQKAAEQGHVAAARDVGMAYEQGRGVAKNDAEALKWYRKAGPETLAKVQARWENERYSSVAYGCRGNQFRFFAVARSRIIRTADNSVMGVWLHQYLGDWKTIVSWGVGDGIALQLAMNAASIEITGQVVKILHELKVENREARNFQVLVFDNALKPALAESSEQQAPHVYGSVKEAVGGAIGGALVSAGTVAPLGPVAAAGGAVIGFLGGIFRGLSSPAGCTRDDELVVSDLTLKVRKVIENSDLRQLLEVSLKESVRGEFQVGLSVTPGSRPTGPTGYATLAQMGVSEVLEVTVMSIGLTTDNSAPK